MGGKPSMGLWEGAVVVVVGVMGARKRRDNALLGLYEV
jgi:hypothetical protein